MRIYQKFMQKVFIVGQVATANVMESDFTTYTLKGALSCSAPTARKYLNELVEENILMKRMARKRGEQDRFTYHLTTYGHEYFLEYRADYITQLDSLWRQMALYALPDGEQLDV